MRYPLQAIPPAELTGKTGTDFVLKAARRAAVDTRTTQTRHLGMILKTAVERRTKCNELCPLTPPFRRRQTSGPTA